jgi:hypothetical protein
MRKKQQPKDTTKLQLAAALAVLAMYAYAVSAAIQLGR